MPVPSLQSAARTGWKRFTKFKQVLQMVENRAELCFTFVTALFRRVRLSHECQTIAIKEMWYRKILISRLVAWYSTFFFYYLEEYSKIVIESPSKIYRKSIVNSTNIYLRFYDLSKIY